MHPVSVSSHLATAYIKSAFPVKERKKVEKGHQSGCDTCVGRPGLPHPLWPPNERVPMKSTADITTDLTSAMGFFILFFSSADKAEVL